MYGQLVCITIFLVFFEARTVVSENSCTVDRNCSATFVYFGFQYNGTANGPPSSSMAQVSLDCLQNVMCKGFITNPSRTSFTPCVRSGIWGLTFTSGMYVKRKLTRLNLGYDPVTKGMEEFITIPGGVAPSDTIYIRFTLLKFDNFQIDFLQDESNINCHFRAACRGMCSDNFSCTTDECSTNKFVKITNMKAGSWSSSTEFVDNNYFFKLNQPDEIMIVPLNNFIKFYYKQNEYHAHGTAFNFGLQTVSSIRISGTAHVHEFSL